MLPSSCALLSLILIVAVQWPCLTPLSGLAIAAKTGSTAVLLLGVPLLTSTLASSAQSDQVRFVRNKWCPWSTWSRCSPEPCIAGIQSPTHGLLYIRTDDLDDSNPKNKRSVDVIPDARILTGEDSANYCVVKPGPLTNRNVYPLLVQTTIDGVIKRREPAKQRVRRCNCRSISLWQIFGIQKADDCLGEFGVFNAYRTRARNWTKRSRTS
ncbi:unnamed protein product [Echinostoma caproni]|uniref:NTR domain-containing protein n=1 Tax=Echinostoma caproni TaxID=27848 RepID=A0A183B9Q2_9TREM|nr:unnamed protein product [Echinostoma caproni]